MGDRCNDRRLAKGVMLPPGLAFVGISEKAWKFSEKSKCPRFYFNFKKERKTSQRTRQVLHLRLPKIIGRSKALNCSGKKG